MFSLVTYFRFYFQSMPTKIYNQNTATNIRNNSRMLIPNRNKFAGAFSYFPNVKIPIVGLPQLLLAGGSVAIASPAAEP